MAVVEPKFRVLTDTHYDFSRILNDLRNSIISIQLGGRDEKSAQDHMVELKSVISYAELIRGKRQTERRVAFHEARQISGSNDLFLGGILRSFSEEEEDSIKQFMIKFANYFAAPGQENYEHGVGGLLADLTLSLERMMRRDCFQPSIFIRNVPRIDNLVGSFEFKWHQVTESYSKVKYKLISAADLRVLHNGTS